MTNETERADTRIIGFVLMGFILLLVGIFGLQAARLFGNDTSQWPVSIQVFSAACFALGAVLLLLTVFAYRTGRKTEATVFAVFGFSMFIVSFTSNTTFANSNWFMYVAVAVVFLVLAIHSLLEEDPKLVALLLAVLTLMFLFLGLACYFDPWLNGPGNDLDVYMALGTVYGILGFVGFVLATYVGLAIAHPKKLPMF